MQYVVDHVFIYYVKISTLSLQEKFGHSSAVAAIFSTKGIIRRKESLGAFILRGLLHKCGCDHVQGGCLNKHD